VVPKQPFLDWLRGVDAANTELTLDDLAAEPTIYLLPAYDSEVAMTEYLSEVYADIFEEELNGWHSDEVDIPLTQLAPTGCGVSLTDLTIDS
jgi:hypothetical protein